MVELTERQGDMQDATQAPWEAWLFALLTAASRLPFLATQPVTFDTGNLALAVDHFDLSIHQPQPPGYLFFVLVARVLRFVAADPNLALGIEAALWSGVAAFLVYRLTFALASRRAAVLAAVFLATNPLFWFHGEVGLVYTAGAAMGLAYAWAAVSLRSTQVGVVRCVALGLGLGALGGFRGSDAGFLLPLLLWGGLHRRPGRVAALAMGWALGMSSWVVPTRLLSPPGTPALTYFLEVARHTSVLFGAEASVHFAWVVRLVFFLACCAGVPGLLAATLAPRLVARELGRNAWLWLLWLGPAAAFFVLIHYTNPGHPLLLIGAPAAVSGIVLSRRPRFAAAAAVASAAWFLLAPDSLSFTTLARLRASDATRNRVLRTIEENPHAAVILLTRTGARGPLARGPDRRLLSLRLDRPFYVLTLGPGPAHLNRVSRDDGRVLEEKLSLANTVVRADNLVFVVHKALQSDLAALPVDEWDGYVALTTVDTTTAAPLPGGLTLTLAPGST